MSHAAYRDPSQRLALDLRAMRRSDCGEVADIHLSAFDGFFLAKLGRSLLELYYQTIVDFGQIGLICASSGRTLGFATGIDREFGFYRKLVTRRAPQFCLSLAGAVAKDPRVVMSIVKRLGEKASPIGEGDARAVTLTSIAIRQGLEGRGAGRALLEGFKAECRCRGFDRIFLETDALGNRRVREFYEKQGFRAVYEYRTAEGREMVAYALDLPVG